MQVISLFSGIGGFELAAQWMGWDNVLSCEINPFGRKVLEHYWPDSYHHDNVKTLNRETILKNSRWNPAADTVVCGGFPCQPYSAAGKRLGTEDDRHLWPEMLRTIREIQPTWVVGENVRGLTNWNGGVVFDQVQADLENEGYEVTPFLLPACAVNAPHRRDRIWFVAYSVNGGHSTGRKEEAESRELSRINRPEMVSREPDGTSISSVTSDTANTGIEGMRPERENEIYGFRDASNTQDSGLSTRSVRPKKEQFRGRNITMGSRQWDGFPTQSPVCSRNDELSSRLVGITFSKHRQESIKAYGNAVVPQLVLQIFMAIEKYNNL